MGNKYSFKTLYIMPTTVDPNYCMTVWECIQQAEAIN